MNTPEIALPAQAGLSALHGFPPEHGAHYVTAAYLVLFTLIQPLAVHSAYFDITETKQICFLLLSAAYVLCVCGIRAYACARARRLPDLRGIVRTLSASDCCMLAFAAMFCLSALLSPFPGEVLFGAANRYQGVLTIALYAALWFCLSRNFAFHWVNEAAIAAGFCAVCALAVLQAFGVDPFFLRFQLLPADRPRYLSTLGNINFYSGYLAVLLPFFLTMWCGARGWRRFLYGGALACGAAGALFTGSESFMLAFVAMLLLAPFLLFGRPRALRRYFPGIMILLAVMQVCFRLWRFAGASELYVSFFMQTLLSPPVWTGTVLVCAALWVLVLKTRDSALVRCRKKYGRLLIALLLLAAAFMLLANTAFSSRSFGAADRFLKLNESWGTDRGQIWRFCIEQFRMFQPLHRLLGGGPGCLYHLDAARNIFNDASIDSAHNEFLHYLLTGGIVGLGCYLGLLISSCAASMRRCAEHPLAGALLLCVLCYLAQSVVSIAQPVSTPYLFLFLGMLRACVPSMGKI